MKDRRIGWIAVLMLCLGVVSVEARGDAPGADLDRFFSQLQGEATSPPEPGQLPDSPPEPGEMATCSAYCVGAAPATVTCSGSCTSVDQSCSPRRLGYAQCSGGSRVYCPNPCPTTCSAEAACPGGGSATCEGYDSCSEGAGFVICDGQTTWCP